MNVYYQNIFENEDAINDFKRKVCVNILMNKEKKMLDWVKVNC